MHLNTPVQVKQRVPSLTSSSRSLAPRRRIDLREKESEKERQINRQSEMVEGEEWGAEKIQPSYCAAKVIRFARSNSRTRLLPVKSGNFFGLVRWFPSYYSAPAIRVYVCTHTHTRICVCIYIYTVYGRIRNRGNIVARNQSYVPGVRGD